MLSGFHLSSFQVHRAAFIWPWKQTGEPNANRISRVLIGSVNTKRTRTTYYWVLEQVHTRLCFDLDFHYTPTEQSFTSTESEWTATVCKSIVNLGTAKGEGLGGASAPPPTFFEKQEAACSLYSGRSNQFFVVSQWNQFADQINQGQTYTQWHDTHSIHHVILLLYSALFPTTKNNKKRISY